MEVDLSVALLLPGWSSGVHQKELVGRLSFLILKTALVYACNMSGLTSVCAGLRLIPAE
jgi:hypothetical protein